MHGVEARGFWCMVHLCALVQHHTSWKCWIALAWWTYKGWQATRRRRRGTSGKGGGGSMVNESGNGQERFSQHGTCVNCSSQAHRQHCSFTSDMPTKGHALCSCQEPATAMHTEPQQSRETFLCKDNLSQTYSRCGSPGLEVTGVVPSLI